MIKDLRRDRRRLAGRTGGARPGVSRAQVVLLLASAIVASSLACGPESYDRSAGVGGAGGAPASDAGADDSVDAPEPVDDADDSGTGDDGGTGVDADADVGDARDAAGDGATMFTCPATINGSIDTTDRTQVGRHNRFFPFSVCGMMKGYPGSEADPTLPHAYDVYRFVNPTAAPVCFNFTLTYAGASVTDAGPDAGQGIDRYMVAYSSFNPTNIASGYLADVGGAFTPPQILGVTVAARTSVDVVVYAIQAANSGLPYSGPYTLSCATQ